MKRFLLFVCGLSCLLSFSLSAQHSVARQWNEALLEGIRNDFARPTVHARNLFHISTAMYDAWAVYDTVSQPFFLGDSVGGYYFEFTGVPTPVDIEAAREEAISYAAYRILKHRFMNSPGAAYVENLFDSVFVALGYDTNFTSVNYSSGPPAALGNYIAQEVIAFGLQDGSNEQNAYANTHYQPVNQAIVPTVPGNSTISNNNRWQPITFDVFIDQAGNVIPLSTPSFLSPEWGMVTPFSLKESDLNIYNRNNNDYWVYHDPGDPAYLGSNMAEEYQWGFSLVSVWSGHNAPDSVVWDISPASIGNVQSYPTDIPGLRNFYDLMDGGDPGQGHTINPVTGQPYAPQMVPRGDYTRVLAEFWADGPDSETPPGHWFTILNYVNDHPSLEKKFAGVGPELSDLEWDIKAYFILSGTMHDVAVTAWGIKGWYDYLRPISAIRYMSDVGQSSDTSKPRYDVNGIPLIPGAIERVGIGDPLADSNNINVGKFKVWAWQGPDSISDPLTDEAGVGWILAENWWPYQRPTFVTPPFAGYVSGHSTFSRAAAEVMTMLTGDPYFPGGMGEFHAPKDSFLVFEEGPSVDLTLQWATYRDASDQCSLSRIWGGIHPPVDDMPGRLMGMEIGVDAFNHAITYLGFPDTVKPAVVSITPLEPYVSDNEIGTATFSLSVKYDELMDTNVVPVISFPQLDPTVSTLTFNMPESKWMNTTTYVAVYNVTDANETLTNIQVAVDSAQDVGLNGQEPYVQNNVFSVDTRNPQVVNVSPSAPVVTSQQIGWANCKFVIVFDEPMDLSTSPAITFPVENPVTLTYNADSSEWLGPTTFLASYDVANAIAVLPNIDISIAIGTDVAGNSQLDYDEADKFSINIDSVVGIDGAGLSLVGGLFKVYPNPTKGQFVIELNELLPDANESTFQVYDVLGHLVADRLLQGRSTEFYLKDAGVYFIHIRSGDLVEQKRVVVY